MTVNHRFVGQCQRLYHAALHFSMVQWPIQHFEMQQIKQASDAHNSILKWITVLTYRNQKAIRELKPPSPIQYNIRPLARLSSVVLSLLNRILTA